MPFLSAVLYVVDSEGRRVGVRRSDGTYAPLVLKIGAGLAATPTQVGGLDVVEIAVDGETFPDIAGVVPSTPDTIPRRGASGELKTDWYEADGGGTVATTGAWRGAEGTSIVGRVSTGGGVDAPMAALSNTGPSYYLGSYRTTIALRTTANVELQYGAGNAGFGRFVSGTPSQLKDIALTDIGPQWYEAIGIRRAARRLIPVFAATAAIDAHDGECITADGDIVVDGVNLPNDIEAEECTMIVVKVPIGSATDIVPATDNTIMGSLGAYTQAGGTTCLYISDGQGDWSRWIAA